MFCNTYVFNFGRNPSASSQIGKLGNPLLLSLLGFQWLILTEIQWVLFPTVKVLFDLVLGRSKECPDWPTSAGAFVTNLWYFIYVGCWQISCVCKILFKIQNNWKQEWDENSVLSSGLPRLASDSVANKEFFFPLGKLP